MSKPKAAPKAKKRAPEPEPDNVLLRERDLGVAAIETSTGEVPIGKFSDGYHTFDELYAHRTELFLALCRWVNAFGTESPWRSKLHSDGSAIEGWFVAGIGYAPGKQISYHLPLAKWGACEFMQTFERAPEYDGHTPADVVERLKTL